MGAGPWPDAQCAPEGKQGAAQALGLSSREGKGWGPRLRAAVEMKVKGWCQGAPNTMTDKRLAGASGRMRSAERERRVWKSREEEQGLSPQRPR